MEQKLIFNENVVNYDKHRPTYGESLYQKVFEYRNIDKSSHVIEVGCGTGQATKPILDKGCSVTAIEIGSNLADFTRNKYANYNNLIVKNESFEEFEIQNDSIDLIISASAFHWIPQEVGYKKALSMLKPRGCLATWWNTPKISDDNLMLQKCIDATYKKYFVGENPNEETTESKCNTIQHVYERFGYADLECHIFHKERIFNAEAYVELLHTYSDHMKLKEDIRNEFFSEIYNAITVHKSIKLIDTINLHLGRKEGTL